MLVGQYAMVCIHSILTLCRCAVVGIISLIENCYVIQADAWFPRCQASLFASQLAILASSHLSEISSLPFFSFSLSGYARSKTFIIFACFCFAWVKEQPKAFHIWNEGQKFPSLKSGISTQLAHLEERSQSLRKALIEAQHSSRSSYVLKVEIPDMSTCTSTVEGQMELDKEDMQGSNQTWHRLLCIYVPRLNMHHDSCANGIKV